MRTLQRFFQRLSMWAALISVCVFSLVGAENARADVDLLSEAKAIEQWIVDHRRQLHSIPELEFDLPKTSRSVRNALDALGVSYTYPVAQSGIIATIGSSTDRIVALRADMDALPITEDTGLNFTSEHDGKMHACGHDAHTAMLLGAAKLLKAHESSLQGTVKLVFQPAEEIGRGARAILGEGHLDDVQTMFGFHVWPSDETGMVLTRSGKFMAGINRFEVNVTGKGGHASMPHLTIDPQVAVANMILASQTVISRRMSTLESNVISVSYVHGGAAFNVIPDTVKFGGTMRSLEEGGIARLVAEFKNIVHNIAAAHQCTAVVEFTMSGDPVVNHPEATATAFDVAKTLLGDDQVKYTEPTMAAEDFARYGQKFPASFIFLGTRNEGKGITASLHTPQFTIDEDILHKGAALHAALAINFLHSAPSPKTEL